jgi:hypothetical protein
VADQHTHKAKLENAETLDGIREKVIFDVMPDISETRRANYTAFEPTQGPGGIQIYKGTSARSYNFSNVRLISRTPAEATVNLHYLHILRSWVMPRFGSNSATVAYKQNDIVTDAKKEQNKENTNINDLIGDTGTATFGGAGNSEGFGLGYPPPVLLFSAFSNVSGADNASAIKDIQTHIYRVPVVIGQVTIMYTSDSTMIPTTGDNPQPMPTIINVDMELNEAQSPRTYADNFSLADYKLGTLEHF